MTTTDAYFEARVDRRGDCHVWTGSIHAGGYGVMGCGDREAYRQLAHRWSYRRFVGPIPEGMCVCHRCDNPPCVNPNHLFLGTQAENMADRQRKGRTPRGRACHQAKLTETTVREIRSLLEQGWVKRDIARAYGINESTLRQVETGKAWGWVI